MPPYSWPTDPTTAALGFEARHKNAAAGALFAWAAWSVDCLHYLDDVDLSYNASPTGSLGHRPDVVDVAHARWATGTCITALDLCAAGLARAFCGHTGPKELDLGDFDPGIGSSAKRRGQLPAAALSWAGAVFADPDYNTVKGARNWLTHSRLPRHFGMAAGGAPQRLSLQLPGPTTLPIRQLIELARDLATRHVTAFVNILPGL